MIKMTLFKNILRVPICHKFSLVFMRSFFFSTQRLTMSSTKACKTASSNLNRTVSATFSDQKAIVNPATPKKKLSHQAQSAIWAERVIRYILRAKPLKDIHSPSLREQITKLQNPDDVHQFEPEPKEKVMRLFTQGIQLNPKIFNQISAQQKKQIQQSENQQNNFIFCPNLLVTKEIFQLMVDQYSSCLLTGVFGISKSVSIILFIQLSNHVNSYLFKAAQPQHNKIRDELLYLKGLQQAYFSRMIPRYWYWSIHPNGLVTQDQLKEILLQQAPQISQQKKDELRSIKEFKEFVRQLEKCYPYFQSYCMKVVVDHFNVVAKLASQWNRKVDQYRKMPKEKINKEQYDKFQKDNRQPAQQLTRLMKSVKCLSNLPRTYYFLISTQIQTELLFRRHDQKVSFGITTPSFRYFEVINSKYLERLKGNLIDFFHNFWFQIERKLKIRNHHNIAIEEMKRYFLDEIKNKQVNYYSKFLFLQEFVTQKKIQQIQANYEQFKKGEYKQNPFKGIYESFTEEINMKFQIKVRQYFLKNKTCRSLNLFYALYEIAVIQSQTSDKDKELTANKEDLRLSLLQYPYKRIFQVINQEILPFTLSQDRKFIKFYWKPEEFASIIKDVLFEIQGEKTFIPQTHLCSSRYWSHRELFLTHCLIQSLKKGADVTFQISQRDQNHSYFQKDLRFVIEENRFTTFRSFNQTYAGNHKYEIVLKSIAETNKCVYKETSKLTSNAAEEYIKQFNQGKPQNEQLLVDLNLYDVYRIGTSTISQNLKNLFEMCDKYPGQFCIAAPDNQQEFDSSSECIDFIIARKFQTQYQIFTFAVSISKNPIKIQGAQAFLSQVLKRQRGNSNYRINHSLLYKNYSSKFYDPNKQLNILIGAWYRITFKSTGNAPALASFERIKKINEFMYNQPI